MFRVRYFVLALQLSFSPLGAAVFTVGPAGAHATVQSAVDAAVATGGDNEIRVQEGLFVGPVAVPVENLTGDLVMAGGWNDAFDVQTEDPSTTVLSGDMAERVIDISGTGAGSLISIWNFTVRDGFDLESGAGIQVNCQECQVELIDLLIVENMVGNDQNFEMLGSAIRASLEGDTHLRVDSCEIGNNRVQGNGLAKGTVQLSTLDASTAEVRDCRIHDNLLESLDGSAVGGAIDAFVVGASRLTVTDNTFANNTITAGGFTTCGGGMEMIARNMASFQISGNLFDSNTTVNSTDQSTGGGVFLSVNHQTQGSFSDNTIVDNRVTGDGSSGAVGAGSAIWINDESSVIAERNIWLRNLDEARGSAAQVSLVSDDTSTLVVRDSVVAGGNSIGLEYDPRGQSTTHLTNLTVVDNASFSVAIGGPGNSSFFNSIVFNNGRNLLIGDEVVTGNNLIDVDPFFIDAASGDYHLMPGSPAVDAGSINPPGGLGEFDLDGEDRDWGGGVDIGAYEVAPSDQTIQYLAQVGNGQAGSIVLSTEIDAASTASDGAEGFTLEFFDSSGAPWEVGVSGELPAGENSLSSVSVLLEPGESWSLETSGLGEVEAGYVRIRSGENTGVTGIFTRRHEPTGTVLYQAGIPASNGIGVRSATLFVDTLGDLETGVAMVNPIDHSEFIRNADLTLTLYDSEYNQIDQTERLLQPGEHEGLFVSQLFPDSEEALEMQGVLTVECMDGNDCVTLVTLRQNDRPGLDYPDEIPTLAAFPVLSGRAPAPAGQTPSGISPDTYYFAQVGNGQLGGIGLQTSFSFANTIFQDGDVQIDFFESSGDPLVLTLEGLGSGSSFNFDLNSGESRVVRTDGLGGIKAGYARVSTQEGVGGSAVFRRIDVPSGILETESGVPSARPLNSFSLFVVTTGDADTGLALANPGPVPAGEMGCDRLETAGYGRSAAG